MKRREDSGNYLEEKGKRNDIGGVTLKVADNNKHVGALIIIKRVDS